MCIVARALPTFSSHGSIRHYSVRDVFSYVVYVRRCLRHSEAEIIIYRFIHKYLQQVCLLCVAAACAAARLSIRARLA